MLTIPNLPHPSAPIGDSDEDAEVAARRRHPARVRLPSRATISIIAGPEGLGLIDVEDGARVSGSRFHYLLGDLVRLEFALVQWGLDKLQARGFHACGAAGAGGKKRRWSAPASSPRPAARCTALETDPLFLVGTAEVPLASLIGERILDAAELPLRYVGYSTCFRREAGAAGKDTRGIFRVHQFNKLEMFSYCLPDTSWDEQEMLLGHRGGDRAGARLPLPGCQHRRRRPRRSAARKFDIEVWLPGQERYRELTSCSNCTDYQARRLGTRFRGEDGKTQFVHMLNGTAITSSRTLLALIEYGQQADGSIETPAVLHGFGAPATIGPKAAQASL